MYCSGNELIVAFKGFVNRLQQTQLSVDSEEDGRTVRTTRTYSGDFTEGELIDMGIKNETGIPMMQQSKIKFSDQEILVFLNMAYERMYNAKMKQVQKMLMDPKVMPSDMDALLQEHYRLMYQSPLIEETTHERFGGGEGKGKNEEKTMDNARIFKLSKGDGSLDKDNGCVINQTNGPITIVTLTIEEFDTDNPWLTTDTPLHTRIARPISNNDLASLGALAKNSRYASGGLYRHKKWMDIHGDTYDIIEVFHNNEEEDKWYNPFDGAYLFIAFQYISYPDKIGANDNKISVTYGYEIAKVAAEIALGKGQ